MQTICRYLLLFVVFSFFVIDARADESTVSDESTASDESSLTRDEIIIKELQDAIDQARVEGTEQSQENFHRFEQRGHHEVVGFSSKDELGAKQKDSVLDEATKDPTQENFHAINNQVESDIEQKSNIDELGQRQQLSSTASRSINSPESFENDYRSKHQFELGTELYGYKYTENIGVKVTGIKSGLLGAYQYRASNNPVIKTWDDFLHQTDKLNIFRFESRVTYGEVEYEGSGTWHGIPDWNFETRGLVGLEIPLVNNVLLTPYGGLGYRYLYNQLSDYPASVVDGQQYYSGYDRESHYVYIPLGIEVQKQLAVGWFVSLKNEVDFFVWGKQHSHLEDMVDENGVNAGYDELENTQERGIGWRSSVRFMRKTNSFDRFIEPFVRYWHIDDSEVSFITNNGSLTCQGDLCQAGTEPDNKTWEYGLNMGAKF